MVYYKMLNVWLRKLHFFTFKNMTNPIIFMKKRELPVIISEVQKLVDCNSFNHFTVFKRYTINLKMKMKTIEQHLMLWLSPIEHINRK